jgi:hypothetical protein
MTFTFPTRRKKRITPIWHLKTLLASGLRLLGIHLGRCSHGHLAAPMAPVGISPREGNECTVNCGSCGKILLRCGWRLKGEESRVGTLQSVCFARDYPVGYTLPSRKRTSELELVFGAGLQYPCKCKAEPHCDRASEDFIMIE